VTDGLRWIGHQNSVTGAISQNSSPGGDGSHGQQAEYQRQHAHPKPTQPVPAAGKLARHLTGARQAAMRLLIGTSVVTVSTMTPTIRTTATPHNKLRVRPQAETSTTNVAEYVIPSPSTASR
jgi:hypothetical protein